MAQSVSLSVTPFLLIRRIQICSPKSMCALQHAQHWVSVSVYCTYMCLPMAPTAALHGVQKCPHCTLTHLAASSMLLRLCSSPGSACCRHRYSAAALAGNSVSQMKPKSRARCMASPAGEERQTDELSLQPALSLEHYLKHLTPWPGLILTHFASIDTSL